MPLRVRCYWHRNEVGGHLVSGIISAFCRNTLVVTESLFLSSVFEHIEVGCESMENSHDVVLGLVSVIAQVLVKLRLVM